jgi:hypothetical protein
VEVKEPLRNGLQQTNVFQVLWGNSLKAHPKGANGVERELPSAVLKVEHMVASLLPDAVIPVTQNVHEEAMLNNGEERELPSAVLKVEHMVASLLPDAVIPVAQNVHEEAMLKSAPDELIQDAEEGEDMPVDTPEADKVGEEEAGEANEEQVDEAVEDEPPAEPDTNGRMPGQLPSAGTEVLAKDYQSTKKAAKDKISALVGEEVTVGAR